MSHADPGQTMYQLPIFPCLSKEARMSGDLLATFLYIDLVRWNRETRKKFIVLRMPSIRLSGDDSETLPILFWEYVKV